MTSGIGVSAFNPKENHMTGSIERAVKLYSGDRPLDLFVQKLPENIRSMDSRYQEILSLFADGERRILCVCPNQWRPNASSPRSSSR